MMFPYVEYDGDKYTFDANENTNETKFLIKIIEDCNNIFNLKCDNQ